jgi:hypothetical protein
VNEYVTVPPVPFRLAAAAASWVSRLKHAGGPQVLPAAVTPVWPGNTIETGTSRPLCSVMVTLSPWFTMSVGPGYWILVASVL